MADGTAFQTLSGDSMPGWHITRGTVDVILAWWQPAPGQGRQSLDLVGSPGAGTIEQSFPTLPGQEYRFSGWVGHNPDLQEARANVYLNGTFFTQLSHNAPATRGDMQWQPFAYTFRATAAVTTLAIEDVSGSDSAGTALDGLAVTLAGATNPPTVSPPPPVPPAIQPAADLPAPSNLTVRPLPGPKVQLTWQDNSTDENAFAVWRKTPGSDWTRIGVLAPNATSFLDQNVAPGTTYTYRVRATRGNIASAWSNEASVTSP